MSRPDRHVIDSALFELEVPDTGVSVADYVRTRLLPLAEAIFDEFSQPGRVVRIDRLELDLGARPPGRDWGRELERRFAETLRAELRNLVPGGAVPWEAAELETLAHLLRRGTLPWTGWSGVDESLDAFAGRVIRGDPRGFARWLRSGKGGGVVVDRLVRHTSDATVAAALAALAGGSPEEWERLLRRGRGADPDGEGDTDGTADPHWTRSGVDAEARRRAFAVELLQRMRRTGPQASARVGKAPVDTPLSRDRGDGEVGPRIPGTGAGAGDPVVGEGPALPISPDDIRERLGAALRTARLAPVAGALAGWVRSHPEVVADALRTAGSSGRVHGLLADLLPESTLLALVRALDPGAVGMAARLLRNPRGVMGILDGEEGLAHQEGPAQREGPSPRGGPAHKEGFAHEEGLRRSVREAILAHLVLRESGAGGDSALLEGVRLRVAPGIPSPYALLQQLLLEEHDGAGVGAALESLRRGHPDDLLRTLELIRKADREVLDRVGRWPVAGIRALAETLLARVSREAGDGGKALKGAVAAAGAQVADPRGFFLGLIQVVLDGGWIDLERLREAHGGSRKGVSGTGDAAGAKTGDPGSLDGTGQTEDGPAAETPPGTGTIRDPRVLREDGTSPSGEGGAALADAQPADGPLAATPLLPAMAAAPLADPTGVVQRLLEEALGAAGERARTGPSASRELRRAVEEALTRDAPRLRRVLERALEKAVAAQALVDALPAPTLARVLLLLLPGAGELLRALDLMVGAAVPGRGSLDRVDREKWSFLLRYLVTEGRRPVLEDTVLAFRDLLLGGGGGAVGGEAAPGAAAPGEAAPGEPAPGSAPLDTVILLVGVRARVAAGTITTPEVGQRILDALAGPRSFPEAGPDTAPMGGPESAPTSGSESAPTSGSGTGRTSGPTSAPELPGGAPPEPGAPASMEKGMALDREVGPPWTTTETLFIANAGIVLAAPYLPRLFSMLEFATETAFHSPEHAARGAHLIQCLVEGRSDRPEYILPLNKILCGLGEDDVLPAAIQPTPREEEMVSGLLSAILQNWGALGNTTVEALQESFFQRAGALRGEEESWHLQVEPRAFDMLIDRIPWSFNTIRFGWMDRVLHVDWRG